MNPATVLMILQLIDITATALDAIPEARARYQKTSAKIKEFVAEGRDPTPEELNEILRESSDLTAAIRAELESR